MTNEEGTGTENLFIWIKNVVAPTEIRTHITLLVYFSYFSKDMRNIQGSNRAIFFQAQKLWFFYLQNFSYDKCWDFLFVSSVVFFLLSHVSLWVSDDNNVCHVLTSVSWELLHNSSLSKHQQQPKQCSVQSSASLGRLRSLFSHVLLFLMFLRQISYTNISLKLVWL